MNHAKRVCLEGRLVSLDCPLRLCAWSIVKSRITWSSLFCVPWDRYVSIFSTTVEGFRLFLTCGTVMKDLGCELLESRQSKRALEKSIVRRMADLAPVFMMLPVLSLVFAKPLRSK